MPTLLLILGLGICSAFFAYALWRERGWQRLWDAGWSVSMATVLVALSLNAPRWVIDAGIYTNFALSIPMMFLHLKRRTSQVRKGGKQ